MQKNNTKQLIGKISSIESLGALDGPGLRTVFFVQGCPVKCVYCHNPEMQAMKGGNVMTVQQVVEVAQRNRPYFGREGGVTFSGGEPLVQAAFVLECIKACKSVGIHTVLDTSGVMYNEAVFDIVDMILLDIKHTDKAEYQKLVGCDMDICLKVLDYLNAKDITYIARQVIVAGINDNRENILTLKKLAKKAIKIELLPYHDMAKPKYERLGWEYPVYLKSPDSVVMEQLNQLLV